MKPLSVLITTLAVGSNCLNAQITLQYTALAPLRSLLSLEVGPKLMDTYTGGSTFTLYNMDLSVYRVLTIPAPPAGYTWSDPNFITEEMFDTDPSTIEYMVHGNGTTPGDIIFKIYRENGTELFSKAPGVIWIPISGSELNMSPPIFETPSGAVMLAQNTDGSPTEEYSLPGHVPCVAECQAHAYNALMGTVENVSVPSGHMFLSNPADQEVTITYQLPLRARSGVMRITDLQGQLVLTVELDNSGAYQLETSKIAAGTYRVSIDPTAGVGMGATLVVVH